MLKIKLSIKNKLLLGIMFALMILASIVLISIWSIQQVGAGADIIFQAKSNVDTVQNLRVSFEKVLMPVHDYLIKSDKAEIITFELSLKKLKEDIARATRIYNDFGKDNYSFLSTINKSLFQIENLARQMLSFNDPLKMESARKIKIIDRKVEKIIVAMQQLSGSDKENFEKAMAIKELRCYLQQMLLILHDHLIYGDQGKEDTKQKLIKTIEQLRESMMRITHMLSEEKYITIIKDAEEELVTIESTGMSILSIHDSLKLEAARLMEQMDTIADTISEELDRLLDLSRKDAEEAKQIAANTQKGHTIATLSISLILGLAGLIGGIIYTKGIITPINQLLEATKRITKGDLSYTASIFTTDEIGSLASSFNHMTDALKNYRDQLLQEKNYIKNIIKNMVDILIVINPDNTINTVSQSALALLGYKEEELIGKDSEIIFTLDPDQKGIEKILREGAVKDIDLMYLNKENKEIPVNFSGSIMKDSNGKILGVVTVARDMREIRELIKNLKAAYKDLQAKEIQIVQTSKLAAIGVLAAGIAHEINNPMNTIINYAEFLEEKIKPNSDMADYVNGILKESERITTIVKNLLKFARKEKQEFTIIDIQNTIDYALSFTEKLLSSDGIRIIKSYKNKKLYHIKGRSNQLEQIFINLIINAKDALNEKFPSSHHDKCIQINADNIQINEKKYIRIIITDNGTGIDEENLDRIFDPFFTTKKSRKGTGLGLSISYGIIKNHGGKIEVMSEKDKYTSFTIDMPVDHRLT